MTHHSEPEWPHQGGQPPQQPLGPPSAGQPGYEQPSYGQPPSGYPQHDQPSYGQPPYGQPPYGQTPYGPPGGYPPGPGGPGGGPYGPPPRNRRTPWILGGIAVLAVAGIAVALILTLRSGSNSSGSATAAVAILLRADVNKDLKTAQNITCEPLHSQINASFIQNPDKSYTIGKATENGDTATVASTIVDADNNSLNVVFDVEKQNGTWKVCNVSEGGSGGGGSGGTDFPSLPTGLPTGGGTGSFCITPNGSTPICVPN